MALLNAFRGALVPASLACWSAPKQRAARCGALRSALASLKPGRDYSLVEASIEKYGFAVKAACRAAKVPAFTPGQFRHSVATWAITKGADPASVAAFLNHKSPRTRMRFYATHATPKKVPRVGAQRP